MTHKLMITVEVHEDGKLELTFTRPMLNTVWIDPPGLWSAASACEAVTTILSEWLIGVQHPTRETRGPVEL